MNFLNDMHWSPTEYAMADVIAEEGRKGILARLEWMTLQPTTILDLGCGAGKLSTSLQERYPNAQVTAVDISAAMLAQNKHSNLICSNAASLPFKANSIDLIIANLLLPWLPEHEKLFSEWKRALRPDGILMLTSFGPDTLKEWRHILPDEEIPSLIDMHDIGDLLLHTGFADPVIDVDYFTTHFKEKKQLLQELRITGMWQPENSAEAEEFMNTPFAPQQVPEVTYELVFAHAFAPVKTMEVSAAADGVVRIPVSHLRQKLRQK